MRPPVIAVSNLITVGWAYGAADLALALSILEDGGVQVLPHTRNMAATTWCYTHALGGVVLQVPASQAVLACELLADFQPERSRRPRLLYVALMLMVTLAFSIPPPPSGFYAASPKRVALLRRINEAA